MTISYLDKIKENVYILLETQETPKTDLLIESYVTEILAYCYRDDVIEPMVLPVSEVIAGTIQSNSFTGFDGDVSSYKEGDMSITFSTGSSMTAAGLKYNLKYNGKLEGFKLIRGIAKCSEQILQQ